MSSSRTSQRLLDIIENIDAIDSYLDAMTFDAFVQDRKSIDATERCLERIIEAITKIGAACMEEVLPSMDVSEVRGLGNRLRHAYDTIDLGTIWRTVQGDLPPLRAACLTVLARDRD